MIRGYETDPVVPGEELLSLPGFWAAYLMWLCSTEDGDEPEPSWFGADEADTDSAYESLSDEERWPAFRVPFGGGHCAVVLARNLAEDAGTEYLITHPSWGRDGYLATLDGHQAGPGLSWRELIHIARTPDPAAPGVQDPNARLLLLLPALGDEDLPADAAEVLHGALVWTGAPAEEARKAVGALLVDHPLWEPAGWTLPAPSPLSGSQAPFTGILYCDEPGSPRCGTGLAQGITREQSDQLARALGTWPED
ncbi:MULTISPECIES: hypothetical protein [unclassified Streptomyces]|uniref:hypothetical protein n=1 Tax=unclassified Streptomyces TaxID=2593676 RepID=UPI002E346D36|nr:MULTISPECIES: hypothetical protein [unclassified Streptomyces]WUC68265.1 hypothetical protein OG861_30685 [Streptomyces sp. NBC_00539]